MKKYLTRRNIIIAVVVLAVAGIVWHKHASDQKAAASVQTVIVTRKDIQEDLSVSGTVKAEKSASLTFPASGKLAYVNVTSGDSVRWGQALAGLDLGDLQAQQRIAYNRLSAANANAQQVEDDVKGHDNNETFAQKNERVAAQSARDIAYDTWLASERAVNNANLYAPFDGIVTGVSVNTPGDTVGITDGVSVVDPTSLDFEIQIDESDLGKVKEGAVVQVKLDAYADKTFAGNLSQIGFVSQTSSTGANVYPAKVKFSPEDVKLLRVGMNGDAKIILGEVKNVLTLPIDSVIDGKVRLADKAQTKVTVQTGLEGDNDVEIKSGVTLGQKVLK